MCVFVCVCVVQWRQWTWAASGDLIPTGLLTQDPPAPGRNSKDPRAIQQNMGTSVGLASVQMCFVCCVVCVYMCVYFVCVCVLTWVSAHYKWSWFPPRCWALWLKQEQEFTALFLSHKHTDTCMTPHPRFHQSAYHCCCCCYKGNLLTVDFIRRNVSFVWGNLHNKVIVQG